MYEEKNCRKICFAVKSSKSLPPLIYSHKTTTSVISVRNLIINTGSDWRLKTRHSDRLRFSRDSDESVWRSSFSRPSGCTARRPGSRWCGCAAGLPGGSAPAAVTCRLPDADTPPGPPTRWWAADPPPDTEPGAAQTPDRRNRGGNWAHLLKFCTTGPGSGCEPTQSRLDQVSLITLCWDIFVFSSHTEQYSSVYRKWCLLGGHGAKMSFWARMHTVASTFKRQCEISIQTNCRM